MKGIPSAVTWRLATFWGGTKRCARRVLPKEEKEVKLGKVVVSLGEGDKNQPVTTPSAS
jgi:hypothetical protein